MPRLGERGSRKSRLFANGPALWIVLGTLVTVLSIAAAAAIQVRRGHSQALEAAEREARAVVSVSSGFLAGEVRRTIERAIQVQSLTGLGGLVASDPSLTDALKVRPNGEVVADRSGAATDGRRLSAPAILAAVARTPSGAAVRLSDPGAGQGSLALAARLPQDDAILVLILKPAAFVQTLGVAARGRPEHLALVDAKDRLIAASPNAPAWLAQVLDDLPPFGARETPVRYVARADGVSVMATAAYLPGFDLKLVSVARASAGLSAWFDSLPLYSIMVFGPSLLGAALAWLLLEQMDKRVRTDHALRRTEERFEMAVAGARCGIWDWNLRTGRIYWSGAMNQLLGRGRQAELMTRAEVLQLLHPDDQAAFDAIEASVKGGATHYDQTFRLRQANGRYLPLRVKGQLFHGVVASADRLIGIAIDISDQFAADRSRQEAEARLRAAIDAAAESFVLWDASDRLALCNGRFLDYFGIAKAEPGETREAIMARAAHPERIQGLPDGAGGEAALEDGIVLARAGARWLLISGRRLAGGGYVSVATDITAMKVQEDELVKRETDLSASVRELETSRLKLEAQAQEMAALNLRLEEEKTNAETANRSKSDFLANMSHELRTPLNAILGFSDVMRSAVFGPLPSKYAEYAGDIHRSGQQLLDLINDILAMAKIESGRLTLETAPMDVPQVLRDAANAAEPEAQAQRLTLTVAALPMAAVPADRRAVKQVLMNLLSNAIKFTPGGGAISLSAAEFDDCVRITVTDTGTGIPAEDLPRIVKPFEKLGSVRSAGGRKGGAGLGLAVSKALIELHGGEFSLDSKLGHGTSVSFTLPFGSRQPLSPAGKADASAAI
jgi:two-component system cell cycle sensor histidine kinase PleC